MFLSAALASTCDALSLGATGPMQRQQTPLFGFASDRGEATSQFEHFSISTDPSDPIAPPPMARPTENSQLARVDQTSSAPPAVAQGDGQPAERKLSVWERNKAADVQGGSLRTWSFQNQHKMDMIQVHMKTDGRPMNANVELWQGPDNVPQKVSVYCEDGRARPFRCFMATPYVGNSISIRNTNTLEYPLQAILEGGKVGMDDPETKEKMQRLQEKKPKICQGGATLTERFQPEVQSVQVFLQSEGRPLQCRIELIQGPNNVKQVMEVYTEEGSVRPFYAILETPGYGTGVVRIINTSTMEFPFSATVEPWDLGNADDDFDAQIAGGSPFFEVSGGPLGLENSNGNGEMGGSFAIAGSTGTSTRRGDSQQGGLAGLFGEAEPAPAPAPVQTQMASPKKSPPPAAAPVETKMVSPKKSPAPQLPTEPEPQPAPPPPVEAEPVILQNEEYANSSSSSSLSQETNMVIPTTATSSPKKSKPAAPAEPEVKPATQRYVAPPTPPPPQTPQRKKPVFLDIDDAFR